MPIAEGNQHLHRILFTQGASIAPRVLIQAADAAWDAMVRRLQGPR